MYLGINIETPRGCSRYRGVLYGTCFIAEAEVGTLISAPALSSAVVQTQHTTEPVPPTTLGCWHVGVLYHVAGVGIEPDFSRL